MATESMDMPLGTTAPNFDLVDARENRRFSLNDINANKGLLIVFGCNHCPYVRHVLPRLNEIIGEFIPQGISALMINSNDATQYPEDSFEKMQEFAEEFNFPMPYLHDETQEVAMAYGAVCTPEFFLFDSELKLVYHGQFDGTRPGKGEATGEDLVRAMQALINGDEVLTEQIPCVGCGIKWK
ncbi:MAG: thioredoxin family protein [Flavobacteriaceae bacterium]|nr:thioredoxin family protein [Flavobacteriaceae bacterium]